MEGLLARAGRAALAIFSGCAVLSGCGGGLAYWDRLGGDPQGFHPFFYHQQLFVEGDPLSVAIDPRRYPSKIGQSYQIAVVNHKTSSEWDADPSLADVTGALESSTLVAGGFPNNTTLAWSNMVLPKAAHTFHRGYDIVADFGGDGRYDPGVDILDSLGVLERAENDSLLGGFALAKDPADAGDFSVGVHDYDLGPFSVDVPAQFVEPGDPVSIHLMGRLYYPSGPGPNQPISPDLASYPIVVIAHGRHGQAPDSYLGYEYLGQHLASRGFICASVALHELWDGWRIHHRAVTILKHLTALFLEPTGDSVVADVRTRSDIHRVGLLGHSRGGEAVVAAEGIFKAMNPPPDFNIRAVAALSPTDGSAFQDIAPMRGPYSPASPYLMIYGTRDGDLGGSGGNTGIRVVDRAPRPRHLIGIYGANHNFFNERWPIDGTPSISATKQRNIAKAFLTSFFTDRLWGAQAYTEFLSGWVEPTSVRAGGPLIVYGDQPERWVHLTLDNAEDSPQVPTSNSLGLANTSATAQVTGLVTFDEEKLSFQEIPFPPTNYFHGSRGLRAAWSSPGSFMAFDVGDRNVTGYEYLSFRVAQRYRGSFEPIANFNPRLLMTISVTLSDASGNSSLPLRLDALSSLRARVPFPDDGVGVVYPKSILQAVRIPLRAFQVGSAVNLASIRRVTFSFDTSATGEMIFDDVEFLGLDLTSPEAR